MHAQLDTEAGVEALGALQPLPGLTLKTDLSLVPLADRPRLLRACAAALAAAGRLDLRVLVESRDAHDLAPLSLVAPLGNRLRIAVEIAEQKDPDLRIAEEDRTRLRRTARALLRGWFAGSEWSLHQRLEY
eukprot:tig00020892_g14927.t1